MTIVISHITAMECWRSGRFDALLNPENYSPNAHLAGREELERFTERLARSRKRKYRAPKSFTAPHCTSTKNFKPLSKEVDLVKADLHEFTTQPMHVLVPSSSARNNLKGLRYHCYTSPLPNGALIPVTPIFSITSPELTFLNMAGILPFHLLVKLGCELCGAYTLQPDGCADYQRVSPPTCVHALDAFLSECGSVANIAIARKALKYVSSVSRSPMETAIATTLCLPCYRGGCGFPKPEMNALITYKRKLNTNRTKPYYLCDLYWRESQLCLEYDSDQEHTGSDRIAHDASRRNDLTAQGITVITATRKQVLDPLRFNVLVHQIAKGLNHRIRKEREGNPYLRSALLRSMVGSNTTAPIGVLKNHLELY